MDYPPHYHDVFSKLDGLEHRGGQWFAKCPSHDDQEASLALTIGDDGNLIVKCHARAASCTFESIVSALGVQKSAFFPPDKRTENTQQKQKSRIVATYDYRDEENRLLYQAVRFEPKDFRQRRKSDQGWVWSLKGVRRVLYRLPEILKSAKQPSPPAVFIVEGEKDVETLRSLGLVATTNAGGAGKWLAEYNEALRDRFVVVIGDNDESGNDHVKLVCENIKPVARELRVVALPGLPEKGDVTNWVEAGGTREKLRELVKDASPFAQAQHSRSETKAAQIETDKQHLAATMLSKAEYLPAEDWLIVAEKLIDDFKREHEL